MENNEPMDAPIPSYALRFSVFGNRALDSALNFVRETCGKEGDEADEFARAWRRGLIAATGTLATLPTRFAVAEEATLMEPPPVRVLLYRQKGGSPAWRILYRVHEADKNDAAYIQIVALRHGSQKPMTPEEGRDIDAANRQ